MKQEYAIWHTCQQVNKQFGIPVNKYVRMGCTPLQWSKLHDRYEPAEIMNLGLLVFTIDHSRQIKQLGTLHTASDSEVDKLVSSNRMCANALG